MIVSRHEVLRSTIKVIDGVPHAVIHESWPLRFEKIDLSALPSSGASGGSESVADRRAAGCLYDLETEPGFAWRCCVCTNWSTFSS